jgi:hypothetical protein
MILVIMTEQLHVVSSPKDERGLVALHNTNSYIMI